MLIDDDIDDIITRGESRTAELSQKYEGLNLEDLNNFKSEMTVQKWEGEDFGGKVCGRTSRSIWYSQNWDVAKANRTELDRTCSSRAKRRELRSWWIPQKQSRG
jgi:hypothetical protein